jgi:FdhD protein
MEASREIQVRRRMNGSAELRATRDRVAVEEPLEIRVGDQPFVVTMRTPGDDEALAAGLVFTEGVVRDALDIERVARPEAKPCPSGARCASVENTVIVYLRDDARVDLDPGRRGHLMNSGCGVCGKQTIEQIRRDIAPLPDGGVIQLETVLKAPDVLRLEQRVFDETGGLHAAGLFGLDGSLVCVREDVGRHNAVDKVLGCAILKRWTPLDRHMLVVSGRSSFEIVQKAARAGIAIVASVSAASSLAVSLAEAGNMTLIGFVRGSSATVYCGIDRVCE